MYLNRLMNPSGSHSPSCGINPFLPFLLWFPFFNGLCSWSHLRVLSPHYPPPLLLLIGPTVKMPVFLSQGATSQCAESCHSRYCHSGGFYGKWVEWPPWVHSQYNLCPEYLSLLFKQLRVGPNSSPYKDSKSIQDAEQIPSCSTA